MNIGCDAPGTFIRLCSDTHMRSLRELQYQYNMRCHKMLYGTSPVKDAYWKIYSSKIPTGNKMYYNREDVEFIQKTSTDHATALDSKIDQITQHMANLGKQLYDLKKTRESVQSLLSKSAEYLEEDDD